MSADRLVCTLPVEHLWCHPLLLSRPVLPEQEPKTEWDTPRVSPYRLAAHLTSAFVIYSGLLWTTLNMFFPTSAATMAPPGAAAGIAALRKVAHPLAALIAITAVSGNATWHLA